MGRNVLRLVAILSLLALLNLVVFAQAGGSSSALIGTVLDGAGEAIAGAEVTVKNKATSAEFKAVSTGNGTFAIPALDAGLYAVTISAKGFKQAVLTEVKLDLGTPASIRVTLEVGAATETITVQGGGAEMVQTQTANISTTISVNQIANLPLVSRNALNFVVFLPGVDTPGTNRNSTINGLPENAINITIDGINVQDNFNKTGDGFFARVNPRLDAVEEVTVSTAAAGAADSGSGAVQIKFATRQGSNDLHGSVYEYHRNPALNSNYWFTNRDGAAYNVETATACTAANFNPDNCKSQRARVLMNQYGFRVGGPITIPWLFRGKDKAFFFVNYEEFRLPGASNEQRTILSPAAQSGVFRYVASGQTRTVNLLELAQRNSQVSTIDPTIGKLLSDIRGTTNKGAVTALTDPNLERFNFITPGNNTTKFPTIRLDFNVTEKHHLEVTWNYQKLNSTPDFLNNRDEAFPGFPNRGSQIGDRYTGSMTLRSTLTPSLVNEFRMGLSGGPSRFNPEASAVTFSESLANQDGYNLAISAAGISNATSTPNASRRNPLLRDFSDNVSWTRGAHSMTFGGQLTQLDLTLHSRPGLVPGIGFSVNANDPAAGLFVAANFPGASGTQITAAQNLYAVLTGRVTSITASALLSEETGKYVYLGESINRGRQRQYGLFAQDSWRMRPNLTLNYGLRWEVQGPFTALNDGWTTVSTGDLYGVSGNGNLFKPGTLTGAVTTFKPFKTGDQAYNVDYNNFAPNFGFAWSPNFKSGWLKRLAGESGNTVIRAGYSMSFNRNGLGDFSGQFGANPGAAISANRDLAIGNLTGGSLGPLPLLFREKNRLGAPPFADTPVYPLTEVVTGDAQTFDPNIKVPYSQSWTIGIQREITKDMAIEVRYVGTRNLQGWTEYDVNDVQQNMLENGLLNEFKLAQANLQANIAANRGSTFKYFGPNTGTSPLPITLAYFNGFTAAQAQDPARYTSTLFANTTFLTNLAKHNPAPATYAANLHSDATRRSNALNAGLAKNFFLTNPDLRGGGIWMGNGGYTRYDALQIEFRRRMSKGLLMNANFSFAKGFASSRFASFRQERVNTLNDGSPGYVPWSFKTTWVYELPVGRGKTFFSGVGGALNHVVSGWEFHGTGRIQSGAVVNFGNVNLVGMTRRDLQDLFKLRKEDASRVAYFLPQDIVENTRRAFSVSGTTASGYSGAAPTGRYIAPANSTTCIQVGAGDCAPQTVNITSPKFTRFDMSAVKRFRISERFNFELRAEFLNAFNNINYIFTPTGFGFNNDRFGEVTAAYTDSSNTQDPGGRLIQIVARFNF